MFDWFKPKGTNKPKTLTAADVGEVIEQYGELFEKYPRAYMDETWLPVPKDQMRLAFKVAWKLAPNAELRNWVEVGWTMLHMFQPGVGQTPVDCKASKDPRDKQALAQLERYLELANASKAEGERDVAEIDEFIRSNR
jgi:hypothetical protein